VTSVGDIWSSATWPPGWDVRHVTETSSTNSDLLDAVSAGTAGPRTVLATDHQTAGRGRLDRRWDAPPATNLLVSIALGPVPEVAAEATHRVALAALGAVRRVVDPASGCAVGLKWPNDLLLDGRKLAGILAQRSATHDVVVVGLGLNVAWAPDGAARLRDAAGTADVSPPAVLEALLGELDSISSSPIAAAYRADLLTIGRQVRVELPAGRAALHGRAVDVDDRGRLVVDDTTGRRHVLDVGDVVHVRAG